ncbi:cell division protein FtsI/penicillin-binding protein 2 [Legionella wadsworthii]|uniref:Cell division protein FtsI/penicillin-binding protein 2 n=1 Tax=Legionella wadsworthii TaxID=28088 RepID=A0A378LMS3_9GAMM|nr:M56 family metallopeptidase [Legionella wadsworthii]STY28315.1 cell division protein FtsI/penicillin-binding protein 2 [Legionella wadsworthii]
MLFLEIFLSIHCLLLLSSWMMRRNWLAKWPSFKLKFARILLVCCVVSPLLVHCIHSNQKTASPRYVSFDDVQEYMSQPLFNVVPSTVSSESVTHTLEKINYSQLLIILVFLIVVFRGYHLLTGLTRLRMMLIQAIPYRTSGRLVIKVSEHCHIPFSVFLFNKAYIILPVSLFSSAENVRIAIAHEGQHHRNGDCLWAYFSEVLRIVFFANPGVRHWYNVLNELQELSCDELLVGHQKISAHDYGRCLFQVIQKASQCSLSSNQDFACTVGMAWNKEEKDSTFILRRISMLSTYPRNGSKPLLLGVAFLGFSIVTPICVAYSAVGTLTSHKVHAVDTKHLNPELQNIAEQEIKKAVHEYHAKSGVIAIADPATGNVLAFAESKQKGQTSWKSRIFSPGSTIKPFIAAAAINSGISSETKSYDCRSPFSIEGQSFTNYNTDVNEASLGEAMTHSINVCFIKVAQEAGSQIVRKKLIEFGFDMSSWWQSNPNDQVQLAQASLGENIPVTVESLTQSYAILANKGRTSGNTAVISENTAASVNHMLENVVLKGTGKNAAIPGIPVAGKTGTVIENHEKHLALFAGFVPADTPRYVILVVIEDGQINKKDSTLSSGGELAAPVFHHVVLNGLMTAKK